MSERGIWVVLFAASCWMIGEGLRMVVMAVFFQGQGWYYFPNTFDVLFDWLPLVILGSILLYESIYQFYRSNRLTGRKSRFHLAQIILHRIYR